MRTFRLKAAGLWASIRRTPLAIENFNALCRDEFAKYPNDNGVPEKHLMHHFLQAQLLVHLVETKKTNKPQELLWEAVDVIQAVVSSTDQSKHESVWVRMKLAQGKILFLAAKDAEDNALIHRALECWYAVLPLVTDKQTSLWFQLNLDLGQGHAELGQWQHAVLAFRRSIRLDADRWPVKFIGGAFGLISALLECGEPDAVEEAKTIVGRLETLQLGKPLSEVAMYRASMVCTIIERIRLEYDDGFRAARDWISELECMADHIIARRGGDYVMGQLLCLTGELQLARLLGEASTQDSDLTISKVASYLHRAISIFSDLGMSDRVIDLEWSIVNLSAASSYMTQDPLFHLAAARMAAGRAAGLSETQTSDEVALRRMRLQASPGIDVGREARTRDSFDYGVGIGAFERLDREGHQIPSEYVLSGADQALAKGDPKICRRYLDLWQTHHAWKKETLNSDWIDSASMFDIQEALKFETISARLSGSPKDLGKVLDAYEIVLQRREANLTTFLKVGLSFEAGDIASKLYIATNESELRHRALQILDALSPDDLINLPGIISRQTLKLRGAISASLAIGDGKIRRSLYLHKAISDFELATTYALKHLCDAISPAAQEEILHHLSSFSEVLAHLQLIAGDLDGALATMGQTRGYRIRMLADENQFLFGNQDFQESSKLSRLASAAADHVDTVADQILSRQETDTSVMEELSQAKSVRDELMESREQHSTRRQHASHVSNDLANLTSAMRRHPDVAVISITQNDLGGAAIVSTCDTSGNLIHQEVGLPQLCTNDLEQISRAFRQMRNSVRNVAGGELSEDGTCEELGRADRELRTVCAKLYDCVFDPIFRVTDLRSKTELMLFAPGRLASLPLHLAFGSQHSGEKADYLCLDVRVSYWPAFGPLLQHLLHQSPEKCAVTLGAVVDEALAEILPGEWFNQDSAPSVEVSDAANPISTLADYDIGFLVCHGSWDQSDLSECGVYINEEHVSVKDAARLHLDRAPTIVLAACDSGVFDTQFASNEFVGMPAAMLQAGASAVVGAMWPVDATGVREYVKQFANCAAQVSNSSAEAAEQAQRSLANSSEKPQLDNIGAVNDMSDLDLGRHISATRNSPVFWGAFFLTGG